jgi:hypothetical protein
MKIVLSGEKTSTARRNKTHQVKKSKKEISA